MKILMVEDEVEIAQTVKLELEEQGYEVSVAYDGLTGLTMARETDFELILLDWMLPGLTGVEICRRLRQTKNQVPIIFVTSQDTISDRIKGLDAGADDYLIKPFNIDELMARVRANLRRTPQQDKNILQFIDLKLDLITRKAYRGEREIELTNKEFQLLECFMVNAQQVLARQQILEKVWGYDFPSSNKIVEVQVRHLRQKLEAKQESRIIHTVRGIGYVLKD